MYLITTFYNEGNSTRMNELLEALRSNCLNSQISHVYVFCESGEDYVRNLNSKIEVISLINRPRFGDLIKFANTLERDTIKIIANTDIYFNASLKFALSLKNNQVYCLGRWDVKDSGEINFYPNFKSQDAWIFRDILPENIGNYCMGIPGCDNRLAHELKDNGFNILNPSLSIQAIHLHKTGLRNYKKSIDKIVGPYSYPLPIGLTKSHSNFEKTNYLIVRRKYYTAILTNTLEDFKPKAVEKFKYKLLEFYFKLRLKLNG